MIAITARDTATKAELAVLDLPNEYTPTIGQVVRTTTGMYSVHSFVEIDLSPVLPVCADDLKKKVLVLNLERLD